MQILRQETRAISIHALVKRATLVWYSIVIVLCYFNPRPRKEGDVWVAGQRALLVYFNPRPRKEGDLPLKNLGHPTGYFNPRPRKEGDGTPKMFCVLAKAFQSTPS